MDDLTTWHRRLDAASSEAEIMDITHDFIGTLRGDIVERLPANLRPGKFKDADEVSSYAVSVVLHRLEDTSEFAGHMEKIATFFTSAAARLTQITARPQKAK